MGSTVRIVAIAIGILALLTGAVSANPAATDGSEVESQESQESIDPSWLASDSDPEPGLEPPPAVEPELAPEPAMEPELAMEPEPEPEAIDPDWVEQPQPQEAEPDPVDVLKARMREVKPVGHWWVDVSALTEARTARSDVRAGAEVMLSVHGQQEGGIGGIIVPWMSGDANVRLESRGDNRGVGATLHAESNVIDLRLAENGREYRFFPFSMHADIEWQARPDLSSRREFWRRPYTRQSIGGEVGFFNPGWYKGLLLGHMGLAAGTVEQQDGDAELRQNQFQLTFALASYTRERDTAPDFEARLLAADADAIENFDGPSANVIEVDYIRLAGIPTGLGLYIDVEAGIADSGGTTSISTSSDGEEEWSTTVTTENLPHISLPQGRARIYGSGESVSGAIEASRSMYLTADVELAIEERITASGRWLNRHGELMLQAFASRNELWLDKEMSEQSVTGGVFAGWRHPLGEQLTLTGSVEVARSFYASLRDDPRPTSELGVNVAATLTRHFGKAWRER